MTLLHSDGTEIRAAWEIDAAADHYLELLAILYRSLPDWSSLCLAGHRRACSSLLSHWPEHGAELCGSPIAYRSSDEQHGALTQADMLTSLRVHI